MKSQDSCAIQLFKAEFMLLCYVLLSESLKPVPGIEPGSSAWKADVLAVTPHGQVGGLIAAAALWKEVF